MSVYLRGTDSKGEFLEVHYGNDLFLSLLETAHSNGWKPAGTAKNLGWSEYEAEKTGEIPEILEIEWDGSYFPPEYQVITDKDAKAIYEALSRIPEMSVDYADFLELCASGSFTIA